MHRATFWINGNVLYLDLGGITWIYVFVNTHRTVKRTHFIVCKYTSIKTQKSSRLVTVDLIGKTSFRCVCDRIVLETFLREQT